MVVDDATGKDLTEVIFRVEVITHPYKQGESKKHGEFNNLQQVKEFIKSDQFEFNLGDVIDDREVLLHEVYYEESWMRDDLEEKVEVEVRRIEVE